MQFIRAIFAASISAVAVIVTGAAAPTAAEAQKQTQPRKRPPVIINDPSVYRPPPPPHDRTYVGPGPTVTPPMERLPKVAPLAQPPIR
jgi:hypothetical protein